LLLAPVVLLGACAGSFERLPPGADLGAPPVAYEQTIKAHFEDKLKDSDSARYKFGKPIKAYANNGLAYGGSIAWRGYMVDVQVNAKNSYGGYVGFKPYMVFFTGNFIHRVYEGNQHVLVHRLE
jgi:hypothetical protein